MGSAPISEAERKRIIKLHGQGKKRNEIAKLVKRAGSTITKVIQEAGGSFERGPGVIAATEAKMVDAKARRAQLQLDLLAKADALLKQIDQPALAFSFGGKENTYNSKTVPEPTFGDKRNIVQAVAIAVNSSISIDKHDKAGENLSAIDAWIAAHLGDGGDE